MSNDKHGVDSYSPTITSEDAIAAIRYVTSSSRPKTAEKLKWLVQTRFEEILSFIETDPELAIFVSDFLISEGEKINKRPLSRGKIQAFRNRLLNALKVPTNTPSPEVTLQEKQYGSPELARLASQVRLLYAWRWHAPEQITLFAEAAWEYLEKFFSFYNNDPEDISGGKINWQVTVKERRSKPKDEIEPWETSDGDLSDEFLKNGDAALVHTIITMLQSYLSSFFRNIDHKKKKEVMSVFKKETNNWRWDQLDKIVKKLKNMPFSHDIMANMREFDYGFGDDLNQLLECWDSYAIQINDYREQKK